MRTVQGVVAESTHLFFQPYIVESQTKATEPVCGCQAKYRRGLLADEETDPTVLCRLSE